MNEVGLDTFNELSNQLMSLRKLIFVLPSSSNHKAAEKIVNVTKSDFIDKGR